MIECETVTLENGKEYIIVSEEVIGNIKYYLLCNETDENDFLYRKEVGDELVGLDDELEFEGVSAIFCNKNLDNQYMLSFIQKYKESKAQGIDVMK